MTDPIDILVVGAGPAGANAALAAARHGKHVVLLDEQFVTLDQLLLVNQLESLKVTFSSMHVFIVDIVDIVSNDLHVVQSKNCPRD